MQQLSFGKILLTTAFCCMASDGKMDEREIALIKSTCKKSLLFEGLNVTEEINTLVSEINSKGKGFILDYFVSLKESSLSEQEELTLIDFAINTIQADEIIEYSEIKFFKAIRNSLKISDENILSVYPEIELFLEKDIISESFSEKIIKQYLEVANFPKFNLLPSTDLSGNST